MTDADEDEDAPPLPRAIDRKLLDALVCPLTRGPLIYDRARGELVSRAASVAFPIRNGVPVMLEDEARPLED